MTVTPGRPHSHSASTCTLASPGYTSWPVVEWTRRQESIVVSGKSWPVWRRTCWRRARFDRPASCRHCSNNTLKLSPPPDVTRRSREPDGRAPDAGVGRRPASSSARFRARTVAVDPRRCGRSRGWGGAGDKGGDQGPLLDGHGWRSSSVGRSRAIRAGGPAATGRVRGPSRGQRVGDGVQLRRRSPVGRAGSGCPARASRRGAGDGRRGGRAGRERRAGTGWAWESW